MTAETLAQSRPGAPSFLDAYGTAPAAGPRPLAEWPSAEVAEKVARLADDMGRLSSYDIGRAAGAALALCGALASIEDELGNELDEIVDKRDGDA